MPKTKSAYRRGSAEHYARLARQSQDSRIRRHITVPVVLDSSRVTKVPIRKRESDAGYDAFTPEKLVLKPKDRVVLDLGIRLCCPKGYFFEIRGRSSIIARGVSVEDNIIDATYTGTVKVVITNRGTEIVKFEVGDRIAQLVFLPQIHVKFSQVTEFPVLPGDRGEAGSGSTGN